MLNIDPIGVIHTPFNSIEDMPIQPKGAVNSRGHIVLKPEFSQGLQDIEGFSHLYLIYHFHQAKRTEMVITPFMDEIPHGVFATRSPLRPAHIGLSVVRLAHVTGNIIEIEGIDVLDGTPLLDIKPYIEQFDAVASSTSGWMQASGAVVRDKRSDGRFK